MKVMLYIIFCIFLAGCTSAKQISISASGEHHPEIKVGDKVEIRTKDGNNYSFEIVRLNDEYIVGEDVSISKDEILFASKIVPSKAKTLTVLGFGLLATTFVIMLDGWPVVSP